MVDTRWLQLLVIIINVTLLLNLVTGFESFDSITSTQSLTQNQTIVSSGEVFELGFFSPGNSNKWYVGIWYKKIPTKTIVWVANKDKPLSSSSGKLKIDENGNNLVLTDESGKAIWQTNKTDSPANTVAQIIDTGNFVLRKEDDIDPGNYFWQSFDHPGDTLLPGMKLGLDKKTGLNWYLTSWKNTDDPSSGDFVYKINFYGYPEFFLLQNQIEVYRSGPWNGLRFSGVPEMGHKDNINFTFIMDKAENAYSFQMNDSSKYSRLSLNSFGVLKRFIWIQTKQSWNVLWHAPADQRDMYGQCGTFGICDTNNFTLCQCIKGFEPKTVDDWNLGDPSGGCVRTADVNCKNDEFLRLENVKIPTSLNAVFSESMSLVECKKICLRNCSCTAYATMDMVLGGSGCVIWVGDLVDLRQYSERGGQELFVRASNRVSDSTTLTRRVIKHLKTFLDSWDLRILILVSLLLQILLIFLAPFRKRVSSPLLSTPLWLAYLLADISATYALGIISRAQTHNPMGPFVDQNLPVLWAPFLLVHLGGPDTITAFALEDNELWRRHAFNLLFHAFVVSLSFGQNFPNKTLWLPTLLLIVVGLIKYTERTLSLFLVSTRRFRDSLLAKPDPGPNYAKLMNEYASKLEAGQGVQVAMIPEVERVETTVPEIKSLSDLEIVVAAHDFFDTFKGLIVDLIFRSSQRTSSRSFFLQRNARDAFKVVEVELNFFYEILYTKVLVVNNIWGYILRFMSISLTCTSLVLFILFDKHKIEKFDVGTTHTLLICAISLDAIPFMMALFTDWTAVILAKNKILFNCFGSILRIDRDRWADQKLEPTSCLARTVAFMAEKLGYKKLTDILHRRWSGSISQYNLIHHCVHRRSKWLEKTISLIGLTSTADSIQYVNTKIINDDIKDLIFEELKMKSELMDDLETSKQLNTARGDWILRSHNKNNLLPWVTEVDFGESLLLWHLATDLLYSLDEEDEEEPSKKLKEKPGKVSETIYRRSSQLLSNYVFYLLVMKSTLMSNVVSTGAITKFRDTCAEADRFFGDRKLHEIGGTISCCSCFGSCYQKREAGKKKKKPEQEDEMPDETHLKFCQSLLGVKTSINPATIKGDRSRSVLFDACMLAKELMTLKGEKWNIISKVWVEFLCYAASRCKASLHAAQLSKGGDLITIVWLLMAHFGFGSHFEISNCHKRAKLVVR